MEAANDKAFSRANKYDNTLMEYNSMYDRMPFVWDTDLNVERILTKVTGNLIKFYRCKMNEPYELKHK